MILFTNINTYKNRANCNFVKEKHEYVKSIKSSLLLLKSDKSHFQLEKINGRHGITLKIYVNISGHLSLNIVGSD